MDNAVICSFSSVIAFKKQPLSTKVILYSLVANIFACWCCWFCGIGVVVCSQLFMFVVDESMASGMDCKMYHIFVTIDGDKKSDVSWNCVSGITCVSGIIVISSGVGFLWWLGFVCVFRFCHVSCLF